MLRQVPGSWAAACGGLAFATEADYGRAAGQEAATAAAALQPQQHERGMAVVAAGADPADTWPQPEDSGCTPSATAACLQESFTAQVKHAACTALTDRHA